VGLEPTADEPERVDLGVVAPDDFGRAVLGEDGRQLVDMVGQGDLEPATGLRFGWLRNQRSMKGGTSARSRERREAKT
jgi:hypothetical protein